MKKIFASFLIVCAVFTSLFAHDGIMSGETDIRVTKTEWFDIIYPARCEQTAAILYEKADSIYKDIANGYGFEPVYRLPVVICPSVEQFNGYWTNGPYNHIVLYDTALIEDLAVFSETFISTFRHECTHAFTYTMNCQELDVITKIFGDPISPVGWNVSSGMAEGATVTNESASGEGRLNDEYSLQMLKQAKIEDSFPDYWDVQGAADIYPTGSFYYFNAAFHEWLQEKYGMLKYGRFWYNCINIEKMTTNRCFKKTYGISITEAWNQFKNSYAYPKIPENPIQTGKVQDFFQRKNKKYSSRNDEGARFLNLSKNERGIVYFDDVSDKVFFVPKESLNKSEIKPTYLFTRRNIDNLSTSTDGRFIAVNYFNDASPTIRSATMIYDMDSKRSFILSDHNFFHPAIIQWQNNYYLIRQTYISPNYGIDIQKLEMSGKKIKGLTPVASNLLPLNVAPFSFIDLGNGHFAYIQKDGLEFSICICDMSCNLLKKINLPKERMVVRYLSFADNSLYFSWAAPGTMPRLGKFDLLSEEFELSEQDFSGGVYYPVTFENQTFYAGKFYRQNRLLVMKDAAFVKVEINQTEEQEMPAEEEVLLAEKSAEVPYTPIPYEKYKAAPYYLQGYWLPYSAYETKTYQPGYTTSYQLPFGITYASSNPWTTDNLTLVGAWGNRTNSAALEVSYTGGTDTNLFNYGIDASSEFDYRGWKKATGQISLTSQYPFGNRSYIISQFLSDLNVGKRDLQTSSSASEFAFGDACSLDKQDYLHWSNGLLFGFSNDIGRFGPGKYEKGGICLYGILYHAYSENVTTSELYFNSMDLQLSAGISIPKLIPIKCSYGMTYNLPSKLNLHLFPASIAAEFDGEYQWMIDVYQNPYALASARFDTLLFGYDLQHGPGIGWVYLYDVQITASYAGMIVEKSVASTDWRFLKIPCYVEKLNSNELLYEDYAGIRATINFGPNFGGTARSTNKFSLYVEGGYAGLVGNHESSKAILMIGFSSLF